MIDYNNTQLRPKTFNVVIERNRNGEFRVVNANMLKKTNQYKSNLVRVNSKELAKALTSSKITA